MFIFHCLIVLIVSMLPVIELRGAIPIGVGLGLPEILTLIIAIIGNVLPVPFIYKFSRKLLELGQTSKCKSIHQFCNFVMKKGEKAGLKLTRRAGDSVFIALFFFIGIPIPGTGIWTGTLAASLLDLDFKKTIKAAICGVLLSGCIMLAVSLGIFKLLFGS